MADHQAEQQNVETKEEKWKREMREYEGKNVQDYSVRLYFWFSTKLEKDKSVLTISSAAIGLLVTVLVTKGIQDYYQAMFYFLAFCGFLVSIVTVINIFDKNAQQIEKNITEDGNINNVLDTYDKIIANCFYLGIIFTILLGLSYGINQFQKEAKKMNHENNQYQPQSLEEGFKKSNEVKPAIPQGSYEKRGFGGSENVRPIAPAAPPTGQDHNSTVKK